MSTMMDDAFSDRARFVSARRPRAGDPRLTSAVAPPRPRRDLR